MRVVSIGGRTGPVRQIKVTGPQGPTPPQPPTLRTRTAPPQADNRAMGERFVRWSPQHGGSYYDFIAWDYLTDTRKLTPDADFFWRKNIDGIFVDFQIPMRQMAWFIRSRTGSPLGGLPALQAPPDVLGSAVLQGKGLSAVILYDADLVGRHARTALDYAWNGLQYAGGA